MKITSDDKQSEVLIESCHSALATYLYPAICVSLHMKTNEVSGRREEVWIEQDEINRFLSQLKALDATRKKAATLKTMTPDDFTLTLFPLDPLGHIGLKATIRGRKCRAGGRLFEFSVEGAFEIDPTTVPQIIADFSGLISKQKESTV